MWEVFRKEVGQYFYSMVAYVSIGIFLVFVGLMVWVVPDFSVLNAPVSSLAPLFNLAPLLFLFLIPALAMRSFAEERAQRTLDLLWTKPLKTVDVVLGKYFAVVFIVGLALIPTITYAVSINALGSPPGNLDNGELIGSYFGMLCLAAIFTSISIFSSALTNNQILAFLLAAILCFLFYFGFYYLSSLPIFVGYLDAFIQQLGIEYHYDSLGKGLIELRDVVYTLTMISVFIFITVFYLNRMK